MNYYTVDIKNLRSENSDNLLLLYNIRMLAVAHTIHVSEVFLFLKIAEGVLEVLLYLNLLMFIGSYLYLRLGLQVLYL